MTDELKEQLNNIPKMPSDGDYIKISGTQWRILMEKLRSDKKKCWWIFNHEWTKWR